MAIVRHLEAQPLQIEARHTEVRATYTMVKGKDGEPYLQIDTYGSSERKMKDKKSQSVRLSAAAARELVGIINRNFRMQQQS
jgi:hypothetical protein